MKRINRREFGRLAGSAALAPSVAWAQPSWPDTVNSGQADQPQQAEPAGAEPKLKLTKEQEERVKGQVKEREERLTALRDHPLPYNAEPAFIFRVKLPRQPRRKGE